MKSKLALFAIISSFALAAPVAVAGGWHGGHGKSGGGWHGGNGGSWGHRGNWGYGHGGDCFWGDQFLPSVSAFLSTAFILGTVITPTAGSIHTVDIILMEEIMDLATTLTTKMAANIITTALFIEDALSVLPIGEW